MNESIALLGHLTPLANAAATLMEERGLRVHRFSQGEALLKLTSYQPPRLVIFPFPPAIRRANWRRFSEELRFLEKVISWASTAGVRRIVLRSHAFVYGSSWKNYGLMEEDRISLLPERSAYSHWRQAEEKVLEAARRADISAAVLRFCNILEPGEGDFLVRSLGHRLRFPLAGHDPRVQFLALEDAAEALVLASTSEESGLFNIAPEGVVSWRDALKASRRARIPLGRLLQKPIRTLIWRLGLTDHPGESAEEMRYSWTVSPQSARTRLGFSARKDSRTALIEFMAENKLGDPQKILPRYDDFGLNPEYLERLGWWFDFLRKVYWRVESEGVENIPSRGAGMLAANHRGFMPFDGVVHRSLILERRGRHVRFLVIPSLFKFPFLSDFLIRQGGVVASQQNTVRLFQRGELVGIFPEGISGAFRKYRGAYRLGPLGRDAYARMAIEHQVPIYPAATIGHVEIFPILAGINISAMTRWNGWPYLPITPTFPLLPLPLPTKWHIRYLEPIHPTGLRPEDADNRRKVKEFSAHFRHTLQSHIDEMLSRRKYLFFGKIFESASRPVKSVATGD